MWLFWRKITKLKLDITYQQSNNNLKENARLVLWRPNNSQYQKGSLRIYHDQPSPGVESRPAVRIFQGRVDNSKF